MKIVYVVTRSDTIGGSHVHVRDLALKMMELGHAVTVVMGGNGPLIDQFRSVGLRLKVIPKLVRNIHPLRDIRAFRDLKRALLDINPDLVSTHSSKAGFLGRLAAHQLRIPVIFTAHGWPFSGGRHKWKRSLYQFLERYMVSKSSFIITVSNYDMHLAQKHLNVKTDRITTIHNGMPDIQSKSDYPFRKKSDVHAVKIARFDRQKDHVELLKAAKSIDRLHIDFIGDGPKLEFIKTVAERYHMINRVTFHGRIEDVTPVLKNADFFCLISNWEGFPRSTLEAMRAGLPVIVSDVGGASEAVINRETGFIVEKGDIDSLHNALVQLVSTPILREKMGSAGRHRFLEQFTFEIMFQKTFDIYQQLLNIDDGISSKK